MFAPTDVCGVIKGCEINNNAKCQGGWAVEGASPYRLLGQVSAAAKSLRSLRIYVLLWDRIAVQIVLLRYFFCLISYFYMLLILQSAPSRLSPNEALPHTPLGALPLDPTSPPVPSLSVRFIYRFARCLGAALPIPHSSLLTYPPLLT